MMQISTCEQKVDDINTLISHLLNNNEAIFFNKVHVIRPDFKNKELSFIRLVTWLYTLYFEAGKDSLKVIKTSMSAESKTLYNQNSSLVNKLRTKLHHNVDRGSSRGFKIEKDCYAWLKFACDKQIPNLEADWEKCSAKLLEQANEVLSVIISELESMTDSAAQKEIFIFNWEASTTKALKPHIYDEIITRTLEVLKKNDVDIVKYRQINYENWNKSISLLNADTNYKAEAEKIVESSIIQDFGFGLPLTVSKLSEHFLLTVNFVTNLLIIMQKLSFEKASDESILEQIKLELPEYLLN